MFVAGHFLSNFRVIGKLISRQCPVALVATFLLIIELFDFEHCDLTRESTFLYDLTQRGVHVFYSVGGVQHFSHYTAIVEKFFDV